MMMIEKGNKAKHRETLLVIVLGFSILYLITGRDWMLYAAISAGVLGTISPLLNRWIHQAWFFLGDKLGFVVSKVVLGAVFFAVLLPMGFLSKLFRKDQMKLRRPGSDGYHRRDHSYTAEDLKNMW